RGLIDDSVHRTDEASKRVRAAGDTMQRIVDSTARVRSLVAEIAQASREQLSGIEQINQAVPELGDVPQGKGGLAAEAARDAREMTTQAAELVEAMSRFRVDGTQPGEIEELPAPSVRAALPAATERVH